MDPLEQELKEALNRKDPSPDFAERVRWNLHVQKHKPSHGLQWWLAATAAVIVTASGVGYRQYEGHRAKEQVMLAMRITGAQMSHIQERVREIRK